MNAAGENIVIRCDVLVVGGGVGAVRAAVTALEQGASVCIAVKGRFGAVGTRGAGASACGATEKGGPRLPGLGPVPFDRDDWYRQILHAGLGLAEPALAAVLVDQMTAAARREGSIPFGRFGFDGPGAVIVRHYEATLRRRTILWEETMIVDLVVRQGRCVGAVGLRASGDSVLIRAGATILASGGFARLFQHHVHPSCVTGDGYAMAFRAGAELINLEFMQFFLMTVFPTRNLFHVRDKEILRRLRNSSGKPFLEDHLPPGISSSACMEENLRHGPFSTRDPASRYLAAAIVKEVLAGRGGAHGGVFLDLRRCHERILPEQKTFLASRGISPDRSPVEVTMGFQCANGGVRIDADGMSTVPGLFAVGETAGGMHGADRIGGTMLAACLVFGDIAGKNAAKWAAEDRGWQEGARPDHSEAAVPEQFRKPNGSTSPVELVRLLGQSAWQHCLALRNETGLRTFLDDLRSLEAESDGPLEIKDTASLIQALELRNLLAVARMVAVAALNRRESRGGHYREDHPHCRMDAPAKAVVVSAAEQGRVGFRETVVDSGWPRGDAEIAWHRWG